MLPGIVVALPAGWLTVRLGERRIVFAGLALAAVSGFAMAAVPGFGTALLARKLGGAGAALLTVALSAMVIGRFPGASLAPAMGCFLAAYPLGPSIALVALPAFGGWRASMLALAVVCALVLIAVPFFYPQVQRVWFKPRNAMTEN